MEIRRATVEDANAVKAIYCHPEMAGIFFDDGIKPEQINFSQLVNIPVAYFIIVSEDGEDIGLFFFYPMNTITFELHTAFLPGQRGRKVIEASRLAREYMWSQTPCRKVVTSVPVDNRRAYVMAKLCGMKQEGINRGSWLKNGQVIDQYTMGICKEVT